MYTTETQKDRFVKAVFIDTADQDYILSRWLYLNHWHRHFYWSAAQAVEKYLKASMVLNGRPVKSVSHDIVALYDTACQIAGDLLPEHVYPPNEVSIFTSHSNFWKGTSTRRFLSRIAQHGNPNNRYDYAGIDIEPGDLYKLDQVIFALRNVAIKLDRASTDGDATENFADVIRRRPEQQVRPFSPKRTLKESACDAHLLQAAYDNNFPFAPPNYPHTSIAPVMRDTVSDLEFLYKSDYFVEAPLLRKWLEENIKLNPKDLHKILNR